MFGCRHSVYAIKNTTWPWAYAPFWDMANDDAPLFLRYAVDPLTMTSRVAPPVSSRVTTPTVDRVDAMPSGRVDCLIVCQGEMVPVTTRSMSRTAILP